MFMHERVQSSGQISNSGCIDITIIINSHAKVISIRVFLKKGLRVKSCHKQASHYQGLHLIWTFADDPYLL